MRQTRVGVVLFALAFVTGLALYVYVTRHGLGLNPDSVSYIEDARILKDHPTALFSLASEAKAGRPAYFAPGYSVALAIPGLLGASVESSDRLLNAMFLGLMLVGYFVLLGRRAGWLAAGLSSGALVLLGGFVARGFGWVLSEAMFLPLFVGVLLLLDSALNEDAGPTRFWGFVAGSGLVAGIATITRPVGVGICAGLVVTLLIFGRAGRRLRSAAMAALVAVVPVIAWRIGLARSGTASTPLGLHPPNLDRLRQFGSSLGGLVLPERAADPTELLWVALFLLTMLWAVWSVVRASRRGASPRDSLTCALVLMTVGYTVAVVGASTFFYASIPFDARIFSPLALTLLGIITLRTVSVWESDQTSRTIRIALGAGLALMVLSASLRTASESVAAHREGLGYTGPRWESSETLAYLSKQSPDVPIFTNARDVAYLYLNRLPSPLPTTQSEDAAAQNPRYETELAEMQHTIEVDHGQVVLFDNIDRSYFPTSDELMKRGLVEVTRLKDGVVLASPPQASVP